MFDARLGGDGDGGPLVLGAGGSGAVLGGAFFFVFSGVQGFDLSRIGSLPCPPPMWPFARAHFPRDQVCCMQCVLLHYSYEEHQFCFATTFLEGSTPSLRYMICPDLVQCISPLLGKPLFVLKQLFALSISGSFLSAHPPTQGGGAVGTG